VLVQDHQVVAEKLALLPPHDGRDLVDIGSGGQDAECQHEDGYSAFTDSRLWFPLSSTKTMESLCGDGGAMASGMEASCRFRQR